MIYLILGGIAAILAVVALFPQGNRYPLLSVAVLLIAAALIVMGYGGR